MLYGVNFGSQMRIISTRLSVLETLDANIDVQLYKIGQK